MEVALGSLFVISMVQPPLWNKPFLFKGFRWRARFHHGQRIWGKTKAEKKQWGVPSLKLTLHPWNLTWNLKITQLKRKIIFQASILRFHVKFQGSTIFLLGRPIFGGKLAVSFREGIPDSFFPRGPEISRIPPSGLETSMNHCKHCWNLVRYPKAWVAVYISLYLYIYI